MLAFTFVLVLGIPFVVTIVGGKRDFFDPIFFFAAGYLLSYPGKLLLLMSDPDTFATYPDLFSYGSDDLYYAVLLSMLGVLAVYFGYYGSRLTTVAIFPRLRIPKCTNHFAFLFLWVVHVLGVLSIAFLVTHTGVSGGSWLSSAEALRNNMMLLWKTYPMMFHFPVYISLFSLSYIHLLTISSHRNYGLVRLKIALSICVSASILLLLGSRALLGAYVLSLLLYYHLVVRRFKTVSVLVIGAAIVILSGYAGVIQKRSQPEGIRALEMRFPVNIAYRLSSSYEQGENLAELVRHRFPFLYGQTIAEDVLYTYIPRVVWSTKPHEFGYIRAQNYLFGDYWDASQDTTYPIGGLGELYLNFGVFGIGAGMLMMGFILGQLKRRGGWSYSFYPVILSLFAVSFATPHRTFGTQLLVLCIYFAFSSFLLFLMHIENALRKTLNAPLHLHLGGR